MELFPTAASEQRVSFCFPAFVYFRSWLLAYQTSSHQAPKHKQLILWNLFQQQIYCMLFFRGESSSQLHNFSFLLCFYFSPWGWKLFVWSRWKNVLHLNDIDRSIAQHFIVVFYEPTITQMCSSRGHQMRRIRQKSRVLKIFYESKTTIKNFRAPKVTCLREIEGNEAQSTPGTVICTDCDTIYSLKCFCI